MWFETPYNTVLAAIEWLPSARYQDEYFNARLAYAFEQFATGGKAGEFDQWLPPFAHPNSLSGKRKVEAFFTPTVTRDVDLAFDLGYLSQAALAALGPNRLRDSGAFARDRSTDTTIH